MNIDEHLVSLDDAGKRLAAAAASAGPDAPVPSCPEWVVRDLVRHQGGVHRWATGYVSVPHTEYWDIDLDEIVGSWPADSDLVEWFTEGHAALIGALRSASPDLACWSFLAAPSPLAMWSRRQAHETTIHRVDAELAAGWEPTVIPPAFAADGVDELVSCFITRPGGRLKADPARVLRITCTDISGDWLVSIGPNGVTTTHVGEGQLSESDCQISGTANDLYLTLWNRKPPTGIAIDGDAGVVDLFADGVKIRWS